MRITIVTDAWEPQVNGVVRTIAATQGELERRGHRVLIIGPDRFRSIPCPTYPEIRIALTGSRAVGDLIESHQTDCLHIATEGSLGLAARLWAVRRGASFTTAFHTLFPDYLAKRLPFSAPLAWAYLRWFHQPANATLTATPALREMLTRRQIAPACAWTRGVDEAIFCADGPSLAIIAGAPGPRLLYVGRVAVEKNLDAFLSYDGPGTKFVVGDGPDRRRLEARYPRTRFLGAMRGHNLAAAYRAADCFVFPSLTDTFGLVMIEALACGTPVAAYDVDGPRAIVTTEAGALGNDIGACISKALIRDTGDCVRRAQFFTWSGATDQFEAALVPLNAISSEASPAFANA